MGKVPCAKAAIDSGGALGAESAAIVAGNFNPILTQEAAALGVSSAWFAKAFELAYDEVASFASAGLAAPDGTDAEEDIRALFKLCYDSCEWAKDMRLKRAEFNRHGAITTLTPATYAVILQGWRDQLEGSRSIFERYLPDDYKPAGHV